MASVHPSRLGLVPQGLSSSFRDGERYSNRDRERERERGSEHRSALRRDDERDRGRGGDIDGRRRGRSPSPPYEKYEKSKVHDEDRQTHERDERPRRRSPDYSSYRREEPPHIATNDNANTNATGAGGLAPWRAQENMYASRGRGGGFGSGGGDDYFASRRLERARKQVNIWPPSPKEPSRDLSDSKKKRSSKRRRSSSVSSSSEDERERRRRKEKKRKEKARDKVDRKDKHKRKDRRERSYDNDGEDDRAQHRGHGYSRRGDDSSDDERRSRSRSNSEKRHEKSQHKSRHSSRAITPPRSNAGEDDGEWVEKPADSFVAVAEHTGKEPHMETMAIGEKLDESDSDEVGPQPAPRTTNAGKKVDERAYGGALLRGEGSAMAAFLQDGDTDARIPRRGEIGLTSEEIATFESVGYVMSGSRHRRMNAVRMRKENQVISAEEKRGILKLQREERERREAILREEFKELVQERLKGTGSAVPSVREEEE